MKTSLFLGLLAISLSFLSAVPAAQAQKNPATEISYVVTFGPVFPIEGSSTQLKGQISFNDTTGTLEKLEFNVPLFSFIGQNAGYLSWVGNSWDYPEMSFRSTKISQKEKEYTVKGNLEFRGQFAPVTINFVRNDKNNEIVLEGEFMMRPHDYFIIGPPIDLVPSNIPFRLTMVFDKPAPESSASAPHNG